jgi:hypothetical protein
VIPENGIEIDWLSVTGVRGKGLVSKIAVFKLVMASMQHSKYCGSVNPMWCWAWADLSRRIDGKAIRHSSGYP